MGFSKIDIFTRCLAKDLKFGWHNVNPLTISLTKEEDLVCKGEVCDIEMVRVNNNKFPLLLILGVFNQVKP